MGMKSNLQIYFIFWNSKRRLLVCQSYWIKGTRSMNGLNSTFGCQEALCQCKYNAKKDMQCTISKQSLCGRAYDRHQWSSLQNGTYGRRHCLEDYDPIQYQANRQDGTMQCMLKSNGHSKEYEEVYWLCGHKSWRMTIVGYHWAIWTFTWQITLWHEDSGSVLVEIMGWTYEE